MLGCDTPWPLTDADTDTEIAITTIMFADVPQPTTSEPLPPMTTVTIVIYQFLPCSSSCHPAKGDQHRYRDIFHRYTIHGHDCNLLFIFTRCTDHTQPWPYQLWPCLVMVSSAIQEKDTEGTLFTAIPFTVKHLMYPYLPWPHQPY